MKFGDSFPLRLTGEEFVSLVVLVLMLSVFLIYAWKRRKEKIMKALGGRKMALGVGFMLMTTTVGVVAIMNGYKGADMTGLGAFVLAQAGGIGAVIWGNVASKKVGPANSA